MKQILTLLILAIIPAQGVLIPAARLTDWTPGTYVGVPGGIPTTRTHIIDASLPPYNADKTGATDASAAIQAAINASVANDIIYLPAGTYRLNSTLTFNQNQDNRTLRGAGVDVTFLDVRSVGNKGIMVGTESDYGWAWPASGNVVTSGLTKGSTTVTIADTSAFSVGNIMRIAFVNEQTDAVIMASGGGEVPVTSTGGFSYMRKQLVRVTAKTATTISFFPGIYHAPPAGLGAKVNVAQLQTDGVGLEDFTLANANTANNFGIEFSQCYASWVKNVKSTNTHNYHIFFWNNLNCEVRHCWLDIRTGAEGSNGAALLVNADSACLFEDNVLARNFPVVEVNEGSSGNVFAYNVAEDSRTFGVLGACFDTNHGAHNSFNLYEGNVTANFQADGYFGSVSEDVLYRNWVHGTIRDHSIQGFTISLNRFCRRYTMIGNLFGYVGRTFGTDYSFGNPNMGNSAFSGDASPLNGDFWADWPAVKAGTNVGPGGFQERDLDVQATVLKKANYHFPTAAIPADEGLGGDVLVPSLFRSSKPAYFGSLTWPPFDPFAPGNPDYVKIPAGYRFINGVDPPTGPDTTPPVLQTKVINAAGNQITFGFNEAVKAGAGGSGGWSLNMSGGPVTLTYNSGDGGSTRVYDIVGRTISAGETGTVTYTQPGNGIEDNPAGNDLATISTPQAVTNNVPGDTTPPTLSTKVINAAGNRLTLTFNEAVAIGLGGNAGWTLNMSGGAATLSYDPTASSGSTLVYVISRVIGGGETGTVSYVQPVNGVEDTSGNDLASLSNQTVTNTASGDLIAPIPNPSTFGIAPSALTSSTITMTATTSTDAGTPPVQYFFNETSGNAGGSDSGWQSSATFTDAGLAAGTQYSYRVQTRDSAVPPNVTTFSATFSTTTKSVAGARPATPFKMARANIVTP